MTFESDLAALRDCVASVPFREMRIRHESRTESSASLVQMLAGDRSAQYQVVALYAIGAVKGDRPVVVVEIDPTADLGGVEQGSMVVVRGWPEIGRAVMLDIDGVMIEPTYPCTSPLVRAMRFK